MVLPDSCGLAYYLLRRAAGLVGNLEVFPERMLANLWSSHGLVFSQPVLLALVAAGLPRDTAYRIVQELALRSWAEGVPFRSLLDADERVTVGPEVLDEAFDLPRSLRHTGAVFDALEAL
jgi:adenylosuccinate lyase